MKTRVVRLSDSEFIPQVYVPHFFWGGHWEGISATSSGSFYRYESENGQLQYCVVNSETTAEKVLDDFLKMTQKRELLR